MDQWDDKTTGKKMSKLKVVVESFHFVDSKGGVDHGETATRPTTTGGSALVDQDDIPFAPQPAMFT
jgi:hypothetical protein